MNNDKIKILNKTRLEAKLAFHEPEIIKHSNNKISYRINCSVHSWIYTERCINENCKMYKIEYMLNNKKYHYQVWNKFKIK